MRANTVFRRLLGLANVVVVAFAFADDGLRLRVKPTWRVPRCSGCGKKAKARKVLTEDREWRHLPWGSTHVYLVAATRRVRCRTCGDRVELLPWVARPRDKFTAPMCDLIAHLAQSGMPKNRVSNLLQLPWETIAPVARRVAEDLLPGDRFDNLRRIAVDEFYWAKKQYITVVWDHDCSRIVWVGVGKSEDTLAGFFKELGPDRCEEIELVTGDMSAAYLNAVKNHAPAAQFVLDHFHLVRLAQQALDEVRRSVVRQLKEQDEKERAKAIKGTRYMLLSNEENLTAEGESGIDQIRRSSGELHRAWSMKESLRHALCCRPTWRARRELNRVIKWMKLSRLRPFVRLGKTLREHFGRVVNSIEYDISNGPLEGCNRKIRGLIFRAFGYRSRDNFIGDILLNCSGVSVPNPLASSWGTSS